MDVPKGRVLDQRPDSELYHLTSTFPMFSETSKKRKPDFNDDSFSDKKSRREKSPHHTSPTSASQGKRDKKSDRKRVSCKVAVCSMYIPRAPIWYDFE